HVSLLERKVQEPHLYLNITFPAPAPTKGQKEIVDLHISIRGDSLDVSEKKKVMLRALQPGILIQTDKAVYKPGQEVKFRVVSLDKDFAPSNEKLPLVLLKDPSGNRIAQWREVSPRQGIVDLSLPLAAEPALGTYVIEVEGKTHSFSVEEYVLPKFEVTIDLPAVVLEKDKKFQMDICGRYTYGKPVPGKVQARLCQSFRNTRFPHRLHNSLVNETKCSEVSGQTAKNGCFSTEVWLTAFNLVSSADQNKFEIQASLVEDGTGLELQNTKSCKILPEIFTVTFENTNEFYRPGIPYTGTMLLKGADGSVLPQKQLLLVVSQQGKESRQTFLTDSLGKASFELETSEWQGMVSLHVAHTQNNGSTPIYHNAYARLSSFFSASRSFLQIRRLESELPCGQPQQLWVDYLFSREALGTELQSLDVVFLVLAKGTIVTVLRKELPAEAGPRGSFSLELPISLELAPRAKVLGYVMLPNGEMAADSIELKVATCFLNKVMMAFSEDRALPSSVLRLELAAAPGSLCAIHAVDRSVLLLKPKDELNTEAVYKALPEFDYPGSIQDPQFCSVSSWDYPPLLPPGRRERDKFRLPGRHHIRLPLRRNSQKDSYKLFQDAALKLFTNAKTRDDCKEVFGLPGPREGLRYPTPVIADQEEPPAPRMYFPETWLWDLVPVGEGGSAEVTVTVPDAITKWEAGMFCTSPLGLAMAPATSLTTFKPFFVELALPYAVLALPYAVVRHEAFTLVATVFNYLRQCLRVQVTLVESAELEVSASADEEYGGCVCAHEARTFQWGVQATSLGEVNITVSTEALSSRELCGNETPVVPAQGRVDTIIKPLLVQPGGILVEKVHNSLLCQEGGMVTRAQLMTPCPPGAGDIMGNALQNLDRLLAMPYGCGEQNMVRFAPNIYIQQYLEKSGQQHPDIRAKAQGLLQRGYQRELLYKHSDGSYSAFGKSDRSGNTWLTAFVLKSFGQARTYVAIDEKHIADALRWLQRQQQETGCFLSVGKLFNNALQGGVSDELSLSAYVTAAMLELGLSPTVRYPPVRAGTPPGSATLCLGHPVLGAAAPPTPLPGGQLHWQRKAKARPASQPSWAVAAPAEGEMTAYVLLAYLSQPQVSSADLGTASQIVRWLSKQQNPYGGFASKPVPALGVALQARAKYAALTYSSNGDFTVTVMSPTGTTQDFVLHNSNRLVLQ
ncbi:Alpha-2-macroglobulin-like 1, partial [Buceros rhinoceros silvestris]